MKKEYEQYGPEWEKEMMKLPIKENYEYLFID